MTPFGDWLRTTRLAAGLSQKALATAMGNRTPSAISLLERGCNLPTPTTLRKIVAVLQIDPATVPPIERTRTKYALYPNQRRLRELGACATPAPGRAVSDVAPCQRCGGAVTGLRPIMHGYLCRGSVPVCLTCERRAQRFTTDEKPIKYALIPNERRKAHLAAQEERMRHVERMPTPTPPAPTMASPVDLWLFDDYEGTGGTLRERLAMRNRERRRREIAGRRVA